MRAPRIPAPPAPNPMPGLAAAIAAMPPGARTDRVGRGFIDYSPGPGTSFPTIPTPIRMPGNITTPIPAGYGSSFPALPAAGRTDTTPMFHSLPHPHPFYNTPVSQFPALLGPQFGHLTLNDILPAIHAAGPVSY